MFRRFHRVIALVLAVAALLAQEPGSPTFDSSAKLVLVPFHVERGKYFAADLQASDFILREDGHPRPFTVFEGPNTAHPLPLELILLFDTTSRAPTKYPEQFRLDPKADYEFFDNWDEAVTREVLQKNGMDIRIAVYHYSVNQLERLCPASSNPREIAQAFHALLDPIPYGKGALTLLPGRTVVKPPYGPEGSGWMAESIVGTLQDAAASPVPARRLLMVFSDGSKGTQAKSLDPFSDIVAPALAMSIPIYPVIIDHLLGQVHLVSATGSPSKGLGELTGGESFLLPEHLNREAMAGILSQVRDTALSQYVVGFSPDAVAMPKKHSLAVALSSKSKGKLVGGTRDGVKY